MTADFWPSGTYDNRTTNRREVWLDGRMTRYVERKCCGDSETTWRELHKPWGEYPDLPRLAATEKCRFDSGWLADGLVATRGGATP